MQENFLISIVITVYNTEKYLRRCLESVTNQSYRNLEIVVVNDCSPGNAEDIIKEYCRNDERVKYVTYEKNKGLFCARLEGAKVVKGDYIAFLDSDDYVTLDFYHCLLKSATNNDSDIVIGKTVFERSNKERYINNFFDTCFTFKSLEEQEIKKKYFSQKGLCFSWHTIWNKLYKKELWDKCTPYYNKINTHLIMTEDIAFSTVLLYYARKITTIQNEAYFYCQNEEASTNVNSIKIERFEKNIKDIGLVFNFVNEFLNDVEAEHWIKKCILETKKYYSRMWRGLGQEVFSGGDKKTANKLIDEFIKECEGYTECTTKDDHFFESVSTKWNGGLEHIKEQILNSDYEYISFDIFDTLIKRPLYDPTDLFYFLDKKFEELNRCNISFRDIRMQGEASARKYHGTLNPSFQDINIDEIYEYIGENYDIDNDILSVMKEEEKRLEIEFCTQRESVKEIYDLALLIGKKIIIVSDMYLDKNTICTILANNGYYNYEKLYLSSDLRVTKNSGEIFKIVIDKLNVKADKILHLGDTWKNDIENAKAIGIDTIFIPKAIEIFENKISGVTTNNCGSIAKITSGIVQNSNKLMDSLGFRSMTALVAQKYFDNPYRSFNEFSDFNIDAYFTGYYAVGMHMNGLIKWLIDESQNDNYKNIHFMSRDGFLLMKAYEEYYNMFNSIPNPQYIYTSRKALMPGMLIDELDFYDLPIEFRNHAPKTILKLLAFCTKDFNKQELEVKLKKNKILYNKPFESREEYNHFIRYYLGNLYDKEKHKDSINTARQYYSRLHKNDDVTFDMGYSGRIQGALSEIVGENINVYFVHADSKKCENITRKQGFKVKNFYDFTPNMTGVSREHIFSDPGPSCIGFKKENDEVKPVFEHEKKDFQDAFVVEQIQNGAIDFIKDYLSVYGKYIKYIPYKSQEVSLVFEGFLVNSKDMDRRIFNSSYFEDDVYGAKNKINIYDFITNDINLIRNENTGISLEPSLDYSSMVNRILWGRNKFIKVITYAIFDRKTLKEKVKIKLKDKPILFRVSKWGYSNLRNFKRIFKNK